MSVSLPILSPSFENDRPLNADGGRVPDASVRSMNVVTPTAMLARCVGLSRAFAALGVPFDADALTTEAAKHNHAQFVASLGALVNGAKAGRNNVAHIVSQLVAIYGSPGARAAAAQSVAGGDGQTVWIDGVRVSTPNGQELELLFKICTWAKTVPMPALSKPIPFYEHLQGAWTTAVDAAGTELAALLAAAQAVLSKRAEAVPSTPGCPPAERQAPAPC